MTKKPVVSIKNLIIFSFSALILGTKSFAEIRVTTPSFPACSNPQGETKVTYKTGTHGIPGRTEAFSGSDSVYNLTADTLTQCFCSENGDGIQTNYWKVSSLSFDEVEYLQKLGWVYIPNGELWGLQEAPYMALNNDYSCDGDGDGDSGDDDKEDDNNDDDDENEDHVGGILLGAWTGPVGEVLGLATTGNIFEVGALLGSGLIAAISGLYLLKKK